MADLTDLEHAVLGVVWRDGPCTPYAIRRHFLASPSPSWSGSAGAIYPAVRRLEQQNFLSSSRTKGDRRGARCYTLTAAGRAALRAWLIPPLPPAAMAAQPDPIRTRLFFLNVLASTERRRFFSEVERGLVERLALERASWEAARREDDAIETLAARGALLQTRARLAWLREARNELG
jgi:DNA-binding PadR family transcriptional regulator